MNAIEIDQAVSELFQQPFDAAQFPFQFLAAFDRNETTLKRLRTGNTNRSDVADGVLQRNHIHIAPAHKGEVDAIAAELRDSPRTASEKARYILATDGAMLHAEDLTSGDVLSCEWADFPNRFGFFLPLAGITTVQAVKENAFDIKATGRLNRLYVELLKDEQNADWRERRSDMNHFMARLIFCFFAEDTDIFHPSYKFTETVQKMSAPDSSNTHEVIETLFRAMNTPTRDGGRHRREAGTPGWADPFPYVNGQLFSGDTAVPRFSKMARSYLLSIGSLNWREINPDIFGSMIQAVADDEERGSLGMHYTSVPNILKVLNPLFLDDLRAKLDEAGENARKLLNLRSRMARIRVFDPACGSGNFLVIAYKEMRKIEAEINAKRGESERKTDIPLTNFRGIELRDFPAEVARLALIIAEYQCDVVYRGQQEALAEFLPLDSENWITCGNALRLDWLSICPPTGTGVKLHGDDLFETPLDQARIDFENAGGETYVCGNPPYVGDKFQSDEQKNDLRQLENGKTVKAIDYIAGWFWKASAFIKFGGSFAFVSTNSVCQGVQVPLVWPPIFREGQSISFCHKDFYWSNNASKNANVICVIVGVSAAPQTVRYIYDGETRKAAACINAYLVDGPNIIVEKASLPINGLPQMFAGNIPRDRGNFMMDRAELTKLRVQYPNSEKFFRRIMGSSEFINSIERYCLWVEDSDAPVAMEIPPIANRVSNVRTYREGGSERGKLGVETPYKFERTITGNRSQIIVPRVSSENREYFPVGLQESDIIVSDAAQAIYDSPLYVLALICSKMHNCWIGLTAGRMKSDYRYSSGVCYNTFPVPILTEQNYADLDRSAKDILLARESYYPATIAEMYGPTAMDAEFPRVRAAHEANDEVLERIYIGRLFKNDTERLEHLFARYSEMTQANAAKPKSRMKAIAHA